MRVTVDSVVCELKATMSSSSKAEYRAAALERRLGTELWDHMPGL